MSRQHLYMLLSMLFLLLSMLACMVQQITPTPTTPDNTATPTPPPAALATEPATQAVTARVIAGSVNVRSEPNGEVVGQIFSDQSVTVLACVDGWCQIETDVLTGYVFEGCLSVETEKRCEAR